MNGVGFRVGRWLGCGVGALVGSGVGWPVCAGTASEVTGWGVGFRVGHGVGSGVSMVRPAFTKHSDSSSQGNLHCANESGGHKILSANDHATEETTETRDNLHNPVTYRTDCPETLIVVHH